MSVYKLPLPAITEVSKVFYDGCKDGKLLYQQCPDCSEVIFFPKSLCPKCMGKNLEWKQSTGRGKIFSYTVTYAYAPPEFMSETPYVLAIVKMDEGYKLMTNIIETDFDKLACELPVEVVFDPVTPEITLPKFRLV